MLDVAGDPSDVNRAYVVVGGATGGVFRTDDLGAHWTNVTNLAAITTQLTSANFTNARLAVSAAAPNPVYLAIADSGQLSGVFWSSNLGVMWTAMDLPQTPDTDSAFKGQPAPQGINPGRQASSNLTIATDPSNPNLVYIAGDRQPDDGAGGAPFPANSVGATNYSARIFRGNTSIAPTGAVPSPQWTPLTSNGTMNTGPGTGSSPHADSRAMVIDNGQLLYSCDGGIFEETNPTTTTGNWVSVNGALMGANNGLQVTQFTSVISYDSNSNIIFGGAQDTGTPQESATGSMVYQDQTQADGPFTAVDDLTTPGGTSHRYIGFGRVDYSNANVNLGTGIGLIPAGGVAGFTGFTGLAVSTVAPAAGNSTRVVIFNGGNPGPGGTALFLSDNAGIATTTGPGPGGIVYTQILTGAGWGGVNVLNGSGNGTAGIFAIAVGGTLGGVANQDVLYAGSGSDVFLRSTAGGTLSQTPAQPAGAGTIQSIAVDPDDWRIAYVTDGSSVFQTTDAGAHWATITGNLRDNNIHTVNVIDGTGVHAGVRAILVGETDGVFRELSNDPNVWTKFGPNFPDSSVWGVAYSSVSNGVLVAGTSGRGAFEVQNTSATLFSQGVLQINGDTDFAGEDDTIKIVLDPNNPLLLDVFLNSTTPVTQVPLASLTQINVNGLGGNDTLIVDSSNGGIPVPIAYDGGTGSNALTLQGGTALTDTYAPGPNVGSGTSTLTFTGGVTETIQFQNLAPVLDTVPGPLTVMGTTSNDVINYGVGSVPANGLVTVNNFESIEFSNKTALTLNAGAGDDTITINNPNTPDGLTAITADGGPGIDTLVVNALGNAANVANAGTVQVTSQLPANYGGIEKIQILNAPDQPLTAVPATIQGTEGAPLTDVVVGGFSDGPNTPGTPKGKASDFTATIDWGDGPIGNPDVTAGQVVDLGNGNFQVLGSHTYAIVKTYTLAVTITDNGSNGTTVVGGVPIMIQDPGGQATQISSQATIVQAPLVAVAQPIFGVEGNAIPAGTLLATFIDNGGAEAEGNYSATVDFGQGSISANVSLVPGSTTNFQVVTATPYTLSQPGTYSLRVVITNNSGPGATSTAALTTTTATIAAAPLTPVLPAPVISTTERVPFTGPVAAFTSANPAAQPGQFTATIDWGDGTPTSAGLITQPDGPGTPFVVVGSHTYADSGVNGGVGTFPLTINVIATTGASVNVGNTASVADVPIDLTGGLNPASDTGVSNSDAITSINQPNFTGKSELNSTIQLFAQPTAGGVPQLVGQTTADASGSWNITTNLLADGRYNITAAATDAAGHTKATREIEPATHPLVIDTIGPKITGLTFDRVHGRINVTFQDELTGMDRESPLNAANYLLSKQQVRMPGAFTLTSITTMAPASPSAPQTVVLTFNGDRQIRGGRYTFTILSGSGAIGVRDAAGNALDGEFYGSFPSGNGHPGGNFVVLLDAIHRRIDAPKSAVGSATPVVPTPPTIIPVSNPKRAFVGVRSGLRPMGQHNRATSVRIHDAALAHISAKRLPH